MSPSLQFLESAVIIMNYSFYAFCLLCMVRAAAPSSLSHVHPWLADVAHPAFADAQIMPTLAVMTERNYCVRFLYSALVLTPIKKPRQHYEAKCSAPVVEATADADIGNGGGGGAFGAEMRNRAAYLADDGGP